MNIKSRYFRLMDDVCIPGRWHIKSPVDAQGSEIIPWRLREGKVLSLEGVPTLPLAQPGHALDFSLTGLNIAVVSGRFASLCERLRIQNEVQLIPARVEGSLEIYFILNALHIIECIDDARCEEVTFWEPRHGEPERVGHYRNVAGLKIDPAKVGEINIFRPWGWTVALIVSERVKLAMEEEGLAGARFIEV